MAIVGAKPKPKSVHIMQGTFQKCRHDRIWNPVTEDIIPPDWLKPEAMENFNFLKSTLKGIGCDSSTFSTSVGILAEVMTERNRLRQIAEETGGAVIMFRIKEAHGIASEEKEPRPNPAYRLFMEQDKRFFSMLSEFGLTPSAMGRLKGLEQPKKQDDPFAELLASSVQ